MTGRPKPCEACTDQGGQTHCHVLCELEEKWRLFFLHPSCWKTGRARRDDCIVPWCLMVGGGREGRAGMEHVRLGRGGRALTDARRSATQSSAGEA
ncbi:hypothetical protein E2C01_077542 [Portunus trituberculatus]|uniref:Uncharacterized protein n=1 Tax=Portunus trituberculatus TaxID=210409 RepID=A0A5B7IMK8_PORTR|nr:hypothetical protein [Portunus trituberculatus]